MSNVSDKNMFSRLQDYLSDEAIKKIITYTFFGLLPILSGFILTPFYTRFLSQEEYGKLSYFNILQGYAALVVILGLDASISRYYFEFKRNDKVLKEMFASAFQFMFFFSFVACCVVFFIRSFLNHDIPVPIYMSIIGTTLFTAIVVTFINYYRDNQDLNKFIVYSVLLFVIMSLSSLSGILFISKDADGCIYGRLAGIALLAFGVIVVNYSFFFQKFSLKLFVKLMLFGLPFIPYSAIGTIYDSFDRFMIEKVFSLKDLAIYNIAFVVAFLINVLVNSLMQTYNPKIFSALNESKLEKERSLSAIIDLRKNMFVIICGCAILLSVLCYPLVYIFAGESYLDSIKYIPLIAFSFVLRLYFTVYAAPLFYYKKSVLLSLIIATAILVFLAAFLLLKNYLGLFSVPIAILCSRSIQIAITYMLIKKANYDFDFGSGIRHKLCFITGIACIGLTLLYFYKG